MNDVDHSHLDILKEMLLKNDYENPDLKSHLEFVSVYSEDIDMYNTDFLRPSEILIPLCSFVFNYNS
jgi:hypothetical protein